VTSGLLNAVVTEDLPGPGSVFLDVDTTVVSQVGVVVLDGTAHVWTETL
jgi:hypothetical protein